MIKVLFLGDIFPADQHYSIGTGVKSYFESNGSEQWEKSINFLINRNDLVIGNLEAPLLRKDRIDSLPFAGSIDFSNIISKAGIKFISIANNHIMEYGVPGFNETISALSKNGIYSFGYSEKHQPKIIIKRFNEISIGMVSFSEIYDFVENRSYLILKNELIEKALIKMKENNVDIKIVGLHWGDEYCNHPSSNQRSFAHSLIDLGCDVIWGHHPHVIQPIELYKNGIIMYSLGNFLFDMFHSKNTTMGIAVELVFSKNKWIKGEVSKYKINKDYTLSIIKTKKIDGDFYPNKRYNIVDKYITLYYKFYRNYKRTYHRILFQVHLLINFSSLSDISKQNYKNRLKEIFNLV